MTLHVEIPTYNCKSVFSLKASMKRRGEMWLCITSVLVWYLGGSFASERYLFPVSTTNSTLSRRYGIIAGAGQVTGRMKRRYPFHVFNMGYDFTAYSMYHAFNPEMKNYRVGTSDSNLSLLISIRRDKPVIPISNLGNKYIFSSCQIPRPIKTEMIIASHMTNQPTEVKVTFSIQGNISHNGKTYVDGDSLNFNIGAMETISFNSEFDLTGTTITTNETVAVFVMLQSILNDIPFEQLIPVTHFGNNYVVATGSRELYRLHIIGEHNDTIITFNNGTQAILRPNQGRRMPSFLQAVGANQSFHFMSSKPVMAILCQFDPKGDPTDLAVVPPVAFYTKYPFVATRSRECKFMTENANTSNAVVHSTRPYQLTWENVTNSSFRVGTFVSFSLGQFQLNFTSKVGVLCFSYSSIHNGGFGTMVNSNDSQHGNEFIIPTGLPWSINFQKHDRNGYLEIESSIPSNSFDSRVIIFYTLLDTCIMVTDEMSSLNLYGSIDTSLFSMLPVSDLGFKYVMSSCYPLNNQTTLLMITTHDKATEVDITLTVDKAYTYDGNTYYNGDVISYSLQSCSTVSLFFNVDVTGTMIEAKNATIAVFSGGTAGGVSTSVESLEQLLPVSQHGTEHVLDVPPIGGALLQIVTAHQNAEVTFNPGESLSLGNTRRLNRVWNESEALVLTSSHPVMTTVCREFERGFVVIPPVHSYRNSHSVSLLSSGPTTVKIVVHGTNGLNISNVGDVLWQNVSEYRVGTQRLFQPLVVHISSVDKFTVLFFPTFGDLVNGGYNFSKEPYDKVLPPKNDDDWFIYGIAAGTGLSVTTPFAFGGFVYIWRRRRRRQEAERSNRERSQAQVDRQVRPSHPGAEKSPPTFKV